MTDLPSTTVTTGSPTIVSKLIWSKWAKWFIETIAIVFWLYAITKLFVFDIDVWAVSFLSPGLVWILDYKLPIILTCVAVAMVTTRSLSLGLAVIYIAFYPFVILFWKVPRFIWNQQSWLLAFAVINAVISFVRSFKRDFVIGTVFLICALLITQFNEKYELLSSTMIVLLILEQFM